MQETTVVESCMKASALDVMNLLKCLKHADNVSCPTSEELKRQAEKFGVKTVFGNYNFVSTVKNRNPWLTV